MSIEVNQITLSDLRASVPTIPNVVLSTAESLILRIEATNLPANTRQVRIVATIFLPNGRPRLRGWFNSRVVNVEPVSETFEVPNNQPRTFQLRIDHPHRVKRPEPWGLFRKAIGRVLVGTALAPLIRLLFSILWHDGPGPYDTEVSLTAHDAAGAPIPESQATFQYPFVSI